MIQDSVNQMLATAAIGAKFVSGEINTNRGLQMDAAKSNIEASKKVIDNPKSDVNQREMAQENIDKQVAQAQKIGGHKFFPNKGLRAQANALQREMEYNPQYSSKANTMLQQASQYGMGAPASPSQTAKATAMQSFQEKGESKITQTEEFKHLKELLETRHSKGAKQREAIQYMNDLEKGGK